MHRPTRTHRRWPLLWIVLSLTAFVLCIDVGPLPRCGLSPLLAAAYEDTAERDTASEAAFRLATFRVDVTPPLGHALLASAVEPAQRIDDPLWLHGLVLVGGGQRIVWAGVDWCEIRNEAYLRWQAALAQAAGTEPHCVLLSALHQHDAPLADVEAERLLAEAGLPGAVCDLAFFEDCLARSARAVREACGRLEPVTHLGLGRAKVDRVASTRRILGPDGRVAFIRNSSSNERGFAEPEGDIDPWLRTLSFWRGDKPLVAVSSYATHPMSYYGRGGVSADFVGLARRLRQQQTPHIAQIYLTGCGANVTAGKYNDGSPANRAVLANRLLSAMQAAWQATERVPLERIVVRRAALRLPPRSDPDYAPEALRQRLRDTSQPARIRAQAALGLSWRHRLSADRPIDVLAIDFGPAVAVLLPGETFLEYQQLAQSWRPDALVMAIGYGDAAPGYVPLDRNFAEGGHDLQSWCWVDPGCEAPMRRAIAQVLGVPARQTQTAEPGSAAPGGQ